MRLWLWMWVQTILWTWTLPSLWWSHITVTVTVSVYIFSTYRLWLWTSLSLWYRTWILPSCWWSLSLVIISVTVKCVHWAFRRTQSSVTDAALALYSRHLWNARYVTPNANAALCVSRYWPWKSISISESVSEHWWLWRICLTIIDAITIYLNCATLRLPNLLNMRIPNLA